MRDSGERTEFSAGIPTKPFTWSRTGSIITTRAGGSIPGSLI